MRNKFLTLRRYRVCSIHDIEDISKQRINATSPKNFNDPLDSYFLSKNAEKYHGLLENIIPENKRELIKMACFVDHKEILKQRKNDYHECLANNEILMWTHYANSHKGICIEYEIPNDFLGSLDDIDLSNASKCYFEKVAYISDFAIDHKRVLEEEIKNNEIAKLLKSFYFLKDKTFEYENEYRLLYFSTDSSLYSKINFNYIKKIIFGIRCSGDTRYLIDCINKQVYNNKIKLYKIDDNFREISYGTE